LSSKQAEEAHAQAAAELARTEVILAQEKVQTDRERAIADRSLEMAVKRVKEAGEVAEANAATEVTVLLKRAKAEAEATHTRAAAEKARMLAESEGSRALIDAENALSTPVLHMKLEQYRLDRMPEIMSHMMKPIEKIDSIRINHVSGFGASQGGSGGGASDEGGGGGGKPPVTQVMDSILGMALQLPALKSIGDQIGVDLSGSIDAASGKSSPKADK
jgi:flotillin